MLLSPPQPGDLVRTTKPWFWTEELSSAPFAAAAAAASTASIMSSGYVYSPYVPFTVTSTVVPPSSTFISSVTHTSISSIPSISQTFLPRKGIKMSYAKQAVNPSWYTTVSLPASPSQPTVEDALIVLSLCASSATLRVMMVDGRIFHVMAACMDDIMRDFELLGDASAWG